MYPARIWRGKKGNLVPAQCELCGKATVFGRNIRHQHSGRWQRKAPRTSRLYKPNLHTQVVTHNGKRAKMRLCTRCLRSQLKVRA